MESTLVVGDFILVEKLSFGAAMPFAPRWRLPGLRAPRRGDLVVFRHPQESREYIKRCVGLGGDLVELRAGALYINRMRVDEPYCSLERSSSVAGFASDFGPIQVPPQHVFVLGDHRPLSRDSRAWGALPVENLRGRAALIYYSWDPDRHRVRWRRMPTFLS